MTEFRLRTHPDWHQAAQLLVDGCHGLEQRDQRVDLMESICLGLGESLYPAFLKLLGLIGSKGNGATQSLITDTLVQALLTGRLPSGHLTAWGMSKFPGERHFGQTRSLGPVEYLLTWYAQPSGKGPLPIQVFINTSTDLLHLISSNEDAKNLYCKKLLADIEDPLDGALSSKTRYAMGIFVERWMNGEDTSNILESFVDALQGDTLSRLSILDKFYTE
ncbi:MAG: hypothetical protein ABW101_02220 [Candidatus Thiodiazotropha sp.]